MIAEVLGRLLVAVAPVLRPDTIGAEALLVVAVAAVALLLHAVLRTGSAGRHRGVVAHAFAELRPLLRSSDPDAAGHRRARAPGTTD